MQHADIPKDFVCECGAAFKTQMRLNYHRVSCLKQVTLNFYSNPHFFFQKIVHTKGEFPCTICNKMFTSLPNWRVHTAQFHRTKDPCVVCGKLVAPGAFMKRHMRTHAPASFECTIEGCTKVFFGKTALMNHQASVHGMGERVSCEICGSSFSTKKVLSKHIARNHSVTERVPCEVPGCTHTAARKDYFIGHIKTHKDIDDAQKLQYIAKIKAMKELPW